MTALLHKLVSDTFHAHSHRRAAWKPGPARLLPGQAEDLKDSASAKASRAARTLGRSCPADDQALWDWLDRSRRRHAHGAARPLRQLRRQRALRAAEPYSGSGVSQHGLDVRLAQADRLARATGLDMVAVGWRRRSATISAA
jgi:ParB family chromosome partitioning protein